VKGRPALAHIPVVLLTGAFEPVDRARAAAAGSDDVLAKPFEPQMVINRVKQLLGGSPRAAATEVAPPRPAPAAPGRPQAVDAPRPARGTSAPGAIRPDTSAAAQTGEQAASSGPENPEGERSQVSLDEYFDQLDAAFSHLRPGQPAEPTVGPGAEQEGLQRNAPAQPAADANADEWTLPDLAGQTPANVLDAVDLQHPAVPTESSAKPPAESSPAHADASDVSGRSAPDVPAAQPAAVSAPNAPTAAVATPAAAQPPIADAFAALLAAEQGEASSVPIGFIPSAVPAELGDAQVDGIVNRVLERLTDRNARDLIVDTVSRIAEKLVREEIDRIKARVK
jgi:hypothetical protein